MAVRGAARRGTHGGEANGKTLSSLLHCRVCVRVWHVVANRDKDGKWWLLRPKKTPTIYQIKDIVHCLFAG